jgi:periplasmic protein CpxP/Spy
MSRIYVTALLSAALVSGAPLAIAQSTGAQGTDAPTLHATPRAEGGHRAMQRHAMKAEDRVEARLAYLRTALRITDAQQTQWEAFASVLRKQSRQMDEFRQARRDERAQQPGQRRSLTAIERLERREKMMGYATQRLNEVLGAAKPLYAALTPEQQQIADELLARRSHRAKGHQPGMHRRGA